MDALRQSGVELSTRETCEPIPAGESPPMQSRMSPLVRRKSATVGSEIQSTLASTLVTYDMNQGNMMCFPTKISWRLPPKRFLNARDQTSRKIAYVL